MIHIGTFEWASTRSAGTFYCPQCQCSADYRERASRPFLTLYFIPVIPIGSLKEFVQCRKCKNRFEVHVIHTSVPPPPPEAKRFEDTLVEAMAAVIWDDHVIDEAELTSAAVAYKQVCGQTLERKTILAACKKFSESNTTSTQFVVESFKDWSSEQQLSVLQALFFVASTKGALSARRNRTLVACAGLFQMPQDQIEAAIDGTLNWIDLPSKSAY